MVWSKLVGQDQYSALGKKSNQFLMQKTIQAVVAASSRLASKKHGALIILQRNDNLAEYIQTGVLLNAAVTPELLLQVFFPNTPLHDGAAIIIENQVVAACVCDAPIRLRYFESITRQADGVTSPGSTWDL